MVFEDGKPNHAVAGDEAVAMSAPPSLSERHGRRARWAVLGVAAFAALVLLLIPSVDWPQAFLAVMAVAVAALVFERRAEREARARAEPQASERPQVDLRLEGLIAALPEPAILVDARLAIRSHNAAAARLFPMLKRAEALPLVTRTPELMETVRRCASGDGGATIDFLDRGAIDRWHRASVAAVRVTAAGRDGRAPDFILISLRDLTEERRLERMRADFVANASHELRTPLASVIGFIETVQGPAKNDAAARANFLAIALSQAQRMARLIDDLLSLSRVELSEHVAPEKPVDLAPLIGHVRDVLAPTAARSNVAIEVNTPEQPVIVPGDRDELIRVIENLIQNAIKYGASGGKVEVGLAREEAPGRPPQAVMTVRDHGPGIAAEHIPRLTERFYRVDAADSRQKGGTGLGLALVKHIVNRHRGRLIIESEPGKGATFTVRIALATAEAA